MGFTNDNIDYSYIDTNAINSRITFLENYAQIMQSKQGNVAEAGVFTGEFAKEINKYFNNCNCFLFDTFTGFDAKDLVTEKIVTDSMKEGYYSISSEDIVINKLPHKEKVKIFKGYFPETVTDEVLNQNYIFVNLDMDLYKPTLEGLRIFYPRMIENGIILIHDYFSDIFPNVKQAILDYEKEIKSELKKFPIGDGISLAIIK